jgi:site-specific recombinase XerD
MSMTPYQKRTLSPLAQRMAGDMCVRNLSQRTIDAYTYHVDRFARFFDKSLDQLGPEEIRTYQLHLIEERKASWSAFNQAVCSLRFLYRITLPRPWVVQQVPFGKRPKRLPSVLGPEEVSQLLACVPLLKHRTILLTLYAAGLRLSEASHLRLADIDGPRMQIHITNGKGRKERLVPISPRLLHELREYWKADRPSNYLFPGKTEDVPLSSATVQKACKLAAALAGIHKSVTPHTLRHSYATGLLEAGVDLLTISRLLGHSSFITTMVYLHVRRPHLESTPSPLDWLPVRQCPRWLDPNQAGPSTGPSNTPVNNNPSANSEPTPPPMPESGPAPASA